MNYYDEIKKELINNEIYKNKTIGIIIVKEDKKYILEYSSDKRIYESTYLIKD